MVLIADRVTAVEPPATEFSALFRILDGGIVEVGVVVGLVALVGTLPVWWWLLPMLTPIRIRTIAHPTSTTIFVST
jgi:hypothetical protein